jgi:hypothetical protein
MSADILLSRNRGLSIGGVFYDAPLARTRELIGDEPAALASADA